VLWGIYTGKFSPTEAAGVTVGFCIIVGLASLGVDQVLPRGQRARLDGAEALRRHAGRGWASRLTEIPSITMRSAQITGILAPLIAVSVVMQQILSLLGAQQFIGDFRPRHGRLLRRSVHRDGDRVHLGMVLESLPVTIILAPILAPVAASVGVEPDRTLR
jgi:C4-dicarboxylate transporter DctM subunit